MTPEEALEELDKVCAQIECNREQQMRMFKALGVLKQVITRRLSQPAAPKQPDGGEPT